MCSDLDISPKIEENNPMEKLTCFIARKIHSHLGRQRKNALRPKRQRTAALQDAGAMERTPLIPRGLGVRLSSAAFVVAIITLTAAPAFSDPSGKVPRFSVDYMDKSVAPDTDFFHFADGNWLKNN